MPTNNAVNNYNSFTGFGAYMALTAENVTGAGTVFSTPFTSVTVNTENCYNPSTGVFTCPVAGAWVFGLSIAYQYTTLANRTDNSYFEIALNFGNGLSLAESATVLTNYNNYNNYPPQSLILLPGPVSLSEGNTCIWVCAGFGHTSNNISIVSSFAAPESLTMNLSHFWGYRLGGSPSGG